MRGKIIFVVGLATGYVLGTRAGRERYEQIKAGAQKVWNAPTVQAGVDKVQELAGARVDSVKADLSLKARNALGALIGREPLSSPQPSRAASSAGSTRPKPAARTAATTDAKPAARPAATKPAAPRTPATATSSAETTSTAAPSAMPAASDE